MIPVSLTERQGRTIPVTDPAFGVFRGLRYSEMFANIVKVINGVPMEREFPWGVVPTFHLFGSVFGYVKGKLFC